MLEYCSITKSSVYEKIVLKDYFCLTTTFLDMYKVFPLVKLYYVVESVYSSIQIFYFYREQIEKNSINELEGYLALSLIHGTTV